MKWRLLALPFGFVAIGAVIDCSSSSSIFLCPTSSDDISANGACSSEALLCPYAGGGFDQSRVGTTSDCFSDFIEYTCTQKKWVVTAQAASICPAYSNGLLSSSDCSLGIGRCAVAAGALTCELACDQSTGTAYSASCVSGEFQLTTISCNGTPLDAGNQEDAATSEDAGPDDAAVDAAESDSGIDAG